MSAEEVFSVNDRDSPKVHTRVESLRYSKGFSHETEGDWARLALLILRKELSQDLKAKPKLMEAGLDCLVYFANLVRDFSLLATVRLLDESFLDKVRALRLLSRNLKGDFRRAEVLNLLPLRRIIRPLTRMTPRRDDRERDRRIVRARRRGVLVTRTSIEVIFLIRGESGLARLRPMPIEGLNLEARLVG